MSGSSTSNDLKDAVRWLRSWTARKGAERGLRRRIERFHRWADQIEEQAEEIERLQRKLGAEEDECERRAAVMIKRAEKIERLREALKGVSSAYGDFAGCSAGTRNGALESEHTPACRTARAVLFGWAPGQDAADPPRWRPHYERREEP
jgi:hypothetical protein